MEEQYTWEHPYTYGDKTEPIQSFEAFKIWVEMGNKRSLKAVAQRMEKSHDTIKKYSCTWKWSERLQDKLTYENKVIHGKQLETVLTSLEIDSRRDIMLQVILGNIVYDLLEATLNLPGQLEPQTNFKTGNNVSNPKMSLIEQLTNVYSKLEEIHTKNQQKLIDYNHKSLTYQSFNNPDEYREMLKHGLMECQEFLIDFKHGINQGVDYTNMGGGALLLGKPLHPYTPQPTTEEMEEKSLPKRKPKTKKKLGSRRRRKKRGRK